jgi:hypothetical protein
LNRSQPIDKSRFQKISDSKSKPWGERGDESASRVLFLFYVHPLIYHPYNSTLYVYYLYLPAIRNDGIFPMAFRSIVLDAVRPDHVGAQAIGGSSGRSGGAITGTSPVTRLIPDLISDLIPDLMGRI